MHILRPQFRIEEQRALAFAAARGFGIIVAADARGPRGSHVPFVIERGDDGVIVQVHLTARNPLVELADGVRRFMLIVAGDDAYVSNDWYASRDNVSTWLYEAVHLSGVAHLRAHDENRGHGDALLAASEARLPKQPWDLAQMEPGKRETMLSGIRVIDLVVDQIEGQSKLNQHKSDADHIAVADQLARSDESGSRRLAGKLRSLRPGLCYEEQGGKGSLAIELRPLGAGLPSATPMRTQEELRPVALRVASNHELMAQFRSVIGSNDRTRGDRVMEEIGSFARSIDPTITGPESSRITLVLLKMMEQEGKD